MTRRTLVVGGGVAAALGAAALGLTLPKLFRRHYAVTPFDDLLEQLTDREAAARIGLAVRAAAPGFDSRSVARGLRRRFDQRNLAEVMDADIAEGRVAEAAGWVLPQSLALLCALTAG